MGTVGGHSFYRLSGMPDILGETVEDVTRPNVDGHAYAKMGKRSRPTVLRGVVDLATQAAVNSRMDTLKALQGTLVTIVTDHGKTHNNVMILAVSDVGRQETRAAVGGTSSGNYTLVVEFVVQLTE